jgi:hypothetical protein
MRKVEVIFPEEFEAVYHALAQWADNERCHQEECDEISYDECVRLKVVESIVARMEAAYAALADESGVVLDDPSAASGRD